MAPEFPPRLVVLTTTIDNGKLSALVEYVEPTGPSHLRVRWSEIDTPAGYRTVGSGFIYVHETEQLFFDGPHRVALDAVAKDRYRWIQGTPKDVPWIMIAMLLPQGYTLQHPQPNPSAAKTFQDRIAVYWVLPGDGLGRTQIEWSMRQINLSLDEEVESLNLGAPAGQPLAAARIDLETSQGAPSHGLIVFLCHASQDKPAIRALHQRLKRDGFTPWLDEEDILPGEDWKAAIAKAVRKSHVVLVCLSRQSSKAGFVQRELRSALDVAAEQPPGTIFIIPLRLEECEVPESLRHLQWVDYTSSSGHERLVKALQSRARELT